MYVTVIIIMIMSQRQRRWSGSERGGASFMGGRERREGKQVFELDQKVGVQDFKN